VVTAVSRPSAQGSGPPPGPGLALCAPLSLWRACLVWFCGAGVWMAVRGTESYTGVSGGKLGNGCRHPPPEVSSTRTPGVVLNGPPGAPPGSPGVYAGCGSRGLFRAAPGTITGPHGQTGAGIS